MDIPVPAGIVIALIVPMYGLIGVLYGIVYKHSNDDKRHLKTDGDTRLFDTGNCKDYRESIDRYIHDVDIRGTKAISELRYEIKQGNANLQNNLNNQLNQIISLLSSKSKE